MQLRCVRTCSASERARLALSHAHPHALKARGHARRGRPGTRASCSCPPLAAEGLTFFGECAAGRGRPLQHVVVEEVERAVVGIPLAQVALVAQVALTPVDLGRGRRRLLLRSSYAWPLRRRRHRLVRVLAILAGLLHMGILPVLATLTAVPPGAKVVGAVRCLEAFPAGVAVIQPPLT